MMSPQSKVEWVGGPAEKDGNRTYYSQVLISGNKVSIDLHVHVDTCMYMYM